MSRINASSAVGGVMALVDAADQMEIYDSLPVELRELARDAFVPFDLVHTKNIYDRYLAQGAPHPRVVEHFRRVIVSEYARDTRICYGKDHPGADPNAVEYFTPLIARRSKPYKAKTRIR